MKEIFIKEFYTDKSLPTIEEGLSTTVLVDSGSFEYGGRRITFVAKTKEQGQNLMSISLVVTEGKETLSRELCMIGSSFGDLSIEQAETQFNRTLDNFGLRCKLVEDQIEFFPQMIGLSYERVKNYIDDDNLDETQERNLALKLLDALYAEDLVKTLKGKVDDLGKYLLGEECITEDDIKEYYEEYWFTDDQDVLLREIDDGDMIDYLREKGQLLAEDEKADLYSVSVEEILEQLSTREIDLKDLARLGRLISQELDIRSEE